MLKPIENLPDGVLGVRAEGTVTGEDYRLLLKPLLAETGSQGDAVRLLLDLPPAFECLTIHAGDLISAAGDRFTNADVRRFAPEERSQAISWARVIGWSLRSRPRVDALERAPGRPIRVTDSVRTDRSALRGRMR